MGFFIYTICRLKLLGNTLLIFSLCQLLFGFTGKEEKSSLAGIWCVFILNQREKRNILLQ